MLALSLKNPLLLASAAFALFSSAGCTSSTTSSPTDAPLTYTGQPGTIPAVFKANILRIQGTVNGSRPKTLIVDTGAAITAIDPAGYSDAAFVSGSAKTIGVGDLTFQNVPAVSVSLCSPSCDATSIDGIFGANILRQFVVGFDYQAPSVTLGPRDVPSTADPQGDVVPFALEGGGQGRIDGSNTVLDVPATRIALDVTVDGVVRHFVLDTGASYLLYRESLFPSLVADGRKTLGVTDQTVNGIVQAQIARTKTVSAGGVLVDNAALQTATDAFIDVLQAEMGTPVDGLLGGAFLRQFYVSIDYPKRAITFYRYTTQDPYGDEFLRVGISLASDGTSYSVGKTFSGTKAATQAPSAFVGATITSIDKVTVAGKDDEVVDRMLRGAVGDTHVIAYVVGGTTQTITLPVEDILAVP